MNHTVDELFLAASLDDTWRTPLTVIICYGRAKLTDKHLASKIHCVDDEIIKWLEHRERRRRGSSHRHVAAR